MLIIKHIHKECPELVSMSTNAGATALHYAANFNSGYEFLEFLLVKNPGAVLARDKFGTTPLHFSWMAFVHPNIKAVDMKNEVKRIRTNLSSLRTIKGLYDLGNHEQLERWWRKINLLLMYASKGSKISQDGVDSFKVVHAIAGLSCNPGLLELALKLYPEQAREFDVKGRLPLHIGCRATCLHCEESSKNHFFTSCCRTYHKDLENFRSNQVHKVVSILDPLISSYPNGASCYHSKLGLPLHQAIMARRKFHGGVKQLINAAPHTLQIRDPVQNLFPFQLAAVGRKSDLTTVFCLLLACPELLVGNAELVSNKFVKKRKRCA